MAGAENTVPEIVCRDDSQPDGLAAFFGHGKRLREQMLLDAAEELVGFEFLFAGRRAAENADVENNDVAAARFDAVEDIPEVIHIEVIAHRHEDVARLGADRFGSQFAFQFEIELVHFDVSNAGVACTPLGNRKDDVEDDGEDATGHGGDRLSEEVDERDEEES